MFLIQFQILKAEPILVSDTIYICTGQASKCYHYIPTCNGLAKCKACVIAMHKDSIPSYYRLCKKCKSLTLKSKKDHVTSKSKSQKKRAKRRREVPVRDDLDEKVP